MKQMRQQSPDSPKVQRGCMEARREVAVSGEVVGVRLSGSVVMKEGQMKDRSARIGFHARMGP